MDEIRAAGAGHRPVLLDEAVAALQVRPEGVYVDATFGGGGYSRALLEAGAGRLVAIDRDPAAVARARELAATEPRLAAIEGRFGELGAILASHGILQVDGIVADLGLSSLQLDDPARGFSFAKDGPLDMRMGRDGRTAAELLATLDEAELARLLRDAGDEPDARRIARTIVAARRHRPLARTGELRELIASVKRGRPERIDPATRTFQALRIAVNEERQELQRLLAAAVDALAPGGRLAIVSFHSGEDRLVKRFVDAEAGRVPGPSRHLPPRQRPARRLAWVQRAVVRPRAEELQRNPRARSARLRVAERLAEEDAVSGPAWRLAA